MGSRALWAGSPLAPSCGTVGTWERGSVCAPVQLGVSATRAICGAVSPNPAICFFPSPRAALLPAGGALAASGGSEATPSPCRGSSWLRGTWPRRGMPCVSRMEGKGSPGEGRGWRRAGSERLGRALAALYGLGPISQLILVPVHSKDTCTLSSTLEDGVPGGLPLQVFLGC